MDNYNCMGKSASLFCVLLVGGQVNMTLDPLDLRVPYKQTTKES